MDDELRSTGLIDPERLGRWMDSRDLIDGAAALAGSSGYSVTR
jgi:hypothetical protein